MVFKALSNLTSGNKNMPWNVKPMHALQPRKYQKEGMAFLWWKERALLTDAPGLGKTLQAAGAAKLPALIACPSYLTEQWATFLQEQYPYDTVALAQGSRVQRTAAIDLLADWTVINIEMLRTYTFPKRYKTFIIDEAHHVKGRTSRQAKAAFDIARRTERVYLLTATPIVREADDLFMLLRILNPQSFTSYYRFIQEHCVIAHTPWADKVVGTRNKNDLRKKLLGYGLGRSYADVGLELPQLIEHTITVQPNDKFIKLYSQVKEGYRLEDIPLISASSVLTVLRTLTSECTEKLDTLRNLLEDVNQPTVVFCWYKGTADRLSKLLNAPCITGDLTPTERINIAKNAPKHVVCTLASMSEGVDLSQYRTVVYYEQDYTYGRKYQSLSRVRRFSPAGHTKPVLAYYLNVKKTVDETVHKCVIRRVSNVRDVLRESLK